MGSFPSDLTLKVNIDPASAIANFKKIEDSIKKGAQGIAGEYEKAAKLGQDMAKQMIDVSSRAGRQLETQLRSIEKQTASLGKTQVEMNEMQRKWMLERARGLKNQEEQEKRINVIYDQRRKYFQEEERRQQQRGPGTGALLFRGARDIFEGRMSYGVMDIGRAAFGMAGGGGGGGGLGGLLGGGAGGAAGAGIAGGISATTMAIGGLTTVFIGAEVAGFKAAESMGEYARQIREVQGVTGMSVREVQQLEIATKLSGRSVEDVVHGMRGFTQALEGGDSAAVKAAKDLQAMGVDVVGLRLGLISTYDALEQMGAALRKNPDAFETNIELMDVLKKSGLNFKQTLQDMTKAEEEASKIHIFSEDEIKQMDKFHEQIAAIHIEVENLFQRLKFWAAQKFEADINLVVKVTDIAGKIIKPFEQGAQIDKDLIDRFYRDIGILGFDQPNRVTLPVPKPPQTIAGFLAGRSEQFDKFISGAGTSGLEGAERRLRELEKEQSALFEKTVANEAEYVKSPTAYLEKERQITEELRKQKDLVDELKRAESDRKTIAEALRRLEIEARERAAHPYGMLAADQRLKAIQELHGVTPAQVAEAAGYLAPFRAEEVQMRVQRAVDQARAAAQRVAEVLGVEQPMSATQFAEQARAQAGARNRELIEGLKRQEQEDREALKPLLEIQTEYRKNQEQAAMRGIRLGGILQVPTIETRLAEEAQVAAVKMRAADQEAEDAKSRLAQEYTTKENYENALVAIRLKHEGEVDAAREEYQAKYLEELRHQVDDIKGKIEPLYQTLFTQPSKFGNQLRQTVQEAALHPIVSGLSEMTATALHPLIFGATGTGGIAGGFRSIFGGGRLSDAKVDSDGALRVRVVNVGGGGGGVGTSIFSVGGYGGGGGTAGFGGGGLFPSLGPGGTTGFTGPVSLGGGAPDLYNLPTMVGPGLGSSLAMMTLGAALGGGRGGDGGGGGGGGIRLGGGGTFNPAAFLKNLKGSFWNENIALAPGVYQAASSMGVGGKLAGVLTSQGAAQIELGAGLPLAMAGITGQRRGTAGGIAESALGGMLTGAGIGTMILPGIGTLIGAGIGAAAGLGIGIGEKIAGVESPRNEAKRLVQSIYHISINNTTADQIVAVANQSYGGRVSIAVRSPEVRHMLGLYAAGTGQGSLFNPSANEPHGASLVESGGGLYQQATYQYGQAFSQSSSLPIYGGSPTHVLGAPGGGVQLSLNIGGQDAARFLQGNVVSPDVISTQMASAMQGSNGRVPQALMMSEPGSIAS